MNLSAAGMYLRTLREDKKLSRTEVAALSGTNESQIVRIEAGQQDTRGSLLVALVTTLKGNWQHMERLMTDPSASVEDAKKLAKEWLAQNKEATSEVDPEAAAIEMLIAKHGPDRVQYVAEQLKTMSRDDLLKLLIALQVSLAEEQEKS